MRRIVLLVVAGFLALATSQVPAANLWTGYKNVTEVQVVEDGGFLLTLSSAIGGSCSVAGPNTLYIYVGSNSVTADGAKAMVASALAALASGMKVNVMYDDSTSYCFGRYLRITQ
jgi:hypothetical protein